MSGKIVTVDFRNDTLFAVERDDGVFVAVKPICDSLGLVWRAQWKRLTEDPILSEGITVTVMPSVGGPQETTLLRLDLVNGWLFGIDERRVQSEEVRQKVLTYKRECYSVLFDHFHGKRRQPQAVAESDEAQENESIKLRKVAECRQVFGSRAAAQLWVKLGLDCVPDMWAPPYQAELFRHPGLRVVSDNKPEAPA